jgi:hypothetical protein
MKEEIRDNDLKVGSRFRLSALGIERCRKVKNRTGVIIGLSPTGSSVRVIFEGRRQPITLHESYVEPDTERSNVAEIDRRLHNRVALGRARR